jgi:hypothetical protein
MRKGVAVSSLTAPAELADFLRKATDVTEIRDAGGTILGVFAPAAPKQYTTRQVFERLLAVTTDEKMRAYLQRKIEVVTERAACGSQ